MKSSRNQPCDAEKEPLSPVSEPSAAFTPGPWFTDFPTEICAMHGSSHVILIAEANSLADVQCEEAAANARLIAAAPDGLALAATILRLAYVEELSTHVEVSFEPHDAALLLALAGRLISKAIGPSTADTSDRQSIPGRHSSES